MRSRVHIRPYGSIASETQPMPKCVSCGSEFKVGGSAYWVEFGKESVEAERILFVILWEGAVCEKCNRALARSQPILPSLDPPAPE